MGLGFILVQRMFAQQATKPWILSTNCIKWVQGHTSSTPAFWRQRHKEKVILSCTDDLRTAWVCEALSQKITTICLLVYGKENQIRSKEIGSLDKEWRSGLRVQYTGSVYFQCEKKMSFPGKSGTVLCFESETSPMGSCFQCSGPRSWLCQRLWSQEPGDRTSVTGSRFGRL